MPLVKQLRIGAPAHRPLLHTPNVHERDTEGARPVDLPAVLAQPPHVPRAIKAPAVELDELLRGEVRTVEVALDHAVAGQAQILVGGDTLYVSNGASDVFALDVETGRILWVYRGNPDPKSGNPIGKSSRGVALGAGPMHR